ncbi:hypothetical protein GQ54DRAFT_199447 [Martensiomyces pterosporus]|nr:hypothetical protein GQ54DRAFT_199447 [Martensiomyces pterosporus]
MLFISALAVPHSPRQPASSPYCSGCMRPCAIFCVPSPRFRILWSLKISSTTAIDQSSGSSGSLSPVFLLLRTFAVPVWFVPLLLHQMDSKELPVVWRCVGNPNRSRRKNGARQQL